MPGSRPTHSETPTTVQNSEESSLCYVVRATWQNALTPMRFGKDNRYMRRPY